MGRTTRRNRDESAHGRERRLSVRSVRKETPELAKLSPVLLALAQAEAEARAEHERARRNTKGQQLPKEAA